MNESHSPLFHPYKYIHIFGQDDDQDIAARRRTHKTLLGRMCGVEYVRKLT